MRVRRWVLTVLVGASLTVAACSTVIAGRPTADPAQTALPTTTTPETSTRAAPNFPFPFPLPTGGPSTSAPPSAPPQGVAATVCGDYIKMDDAAKRQVIDAIGQQNSLVGINPELWVGLADAMCTFADPSTLVSDAVQGGGFR
jgi:hypothetical protein